MRLAIILLFCVSSIYTNAQVDTIVPASFKGGDEALYLYIGKNLRTPMKAKQNMVNGVVKVLFVIDSLGKVKNPKVTVGLGYGCDEAAIELVESMPDWNPATKAGIPVNSAQVLPIRFMCIETPPVTFESVYGNTSPFTQSFLDSLKKEALLKAEEKNNNFIRTEEVKVGESITDPKENLKFWKTKYRGDPTNPFYHLQIGKAQLKLNKPSAACTSFTKAVDLGSDEAKKYLEENCSQE